MKKLFYILMYLFPVVVFSQQGWYKSSPLDYMWMNVGNSCFSEGSAPELSFAFSPAGEPYVAYQDVPNSYKATVMKFDGTNWVNVGNAGFSAGHIWFTSLAFSPSGEPYVAYDDSANSEKATVMKFDGTNWVNVGNPGFSVTRARYESLAFSPSGEPYVAYCEYANSLKAAVMKFDGNSWVNVGNVGFSAGMIENTSLAFSPSGEPYVAYVDLGNSYKATVMKFDGTNWVNVGNAGFSVGPVLYTSLAFSPTDGLPYVAFWDGDTSVGGASVMKFYGNNWVYVGNAGFYVGDSWYTSLAFSPSGEPYVAYEEYSMYGPDKASVMKFDGSNWMNVGNAGFSEASVEWTSLAFSPSDGQPYVAYADGVQANGIYGKATVMKYDSLHVGIMEQQEPRLSIYPNPASDIITLNINNIKNEEFELNIFNIIGELVRSGMMKQNQRQISIRDLCDGIYMVEIKSKKGSEKQKLIIQR